MSLVELQQVHKSFGHVAAVQGISLNLNEAEVLGFFGHNGAGKTTTMKMILGLEKPTAGTISVFGKTPWKSSFSPFRFDIGFLPENVSFYQQLTGLEVLQHFARLKRVNRKRCHQLMLELDLKHAENRKVKTYSKGMKQRLGLAQALLCEPRLLILDEPTTGLDPLATQQFYEIVDTLKSNGCSILLCSHLLPGAERHIDRAAILGQGRLQALGTLDELRARAALPLTIRIKTDSQRDSILEFLNKNNISTSSVIPINGHTLQFDALPEHKMMVLRDLVNNPLVQDVDITKPSLDLLYRHFSLPRQEDI